jgi:hypothetical protein
MEGTEVGVLHETNQVGFGCFLESSNGCCLKLEVVLVLLSDLPDQPLKEEVC